MKAVAAILLLALAAYARADDTVATATAIADGDYSNAHAVAHASDDDKYVKPGFYEYSGYEDYDPSYKSYKFGYGFKRVKSFDPSYYSIFHGKKCGLDKYYSCKDGHCGGPVCKTHWKPCGKHDCSYGEECVEFKDGYKCVEYECKKDGLKCYIGAKKICKDDYVCYDDDCYEEKVLVCDHHGRKLRAEASAVAEALGDNSSADALAEAEGEDSFADAVAIAEGEGADADARAFANSDDGLVGGKKFKHGGFDGKGGYDYYYEEPYYADPKCYYKIVKKCKERCEYVKKCHFKVGEVCEKDPGACKKEPVPCGDGYCKPGDYCEKPDCYAKDKCFFYDKFHCW